MGKKKWCIISLLLSVVATAIGSGTMGIMLSEIVDEYQLLPQQEGLMSSFISMGALTALGIGIIFRGYIQKVQFIIGGGILMSFMLIGKGFHVSFVPFLILCFLMGTGMGIMDSYQSSFLTDLTIKNAAKSLGFLHGIFGIGGIVLPIILHKLLQKFSWRAVYLILGIVCFILIFQFMFTVFRCSSEIPAIKKLEKSQNFQQMRGFLKKPYFIFLLLCMFLGAMAQNGILIWTVRYVTVVLGNAGLASICLALFWAASTVSRVAVPYIRISSMKLLGIGSVLSGVAWGIGIYMRNAEIMLWVCGVVGLTSGCCIPLLLNEGVMFSTNNTGLTTSMLMIVKTLGQILMPILVAFIQALYSTSISMNFVAVIFIADGAIVAIMMRLKMRRGVFS